MRLGAVAEREIADADADVFDELEVCAFAARATGDPSPEASPIDAIDRTRTSEDVAARRHARYPRMIEPPSPPEGAS